MKLYYALTNTQEQLMYLTNEDVALIHSALLYTITHGYAEVDDNELVSMRLVYNAIEHELKNRSNMVLPEFN